MKICPKCNKEYPLGIRFCSQDGGELVEKPASTSSPTSANKSVAGRDLTQNVSHHSETNVYNQDETKKMMQCVVSGRSAVTSEGAFCRSCNEWAHSDYFNLSRRICKICEDQESGDKENIYRTMVAEFYGDDHKLDSEERKKLDLKAEELGLASELRSRIESQERSKDVLSLDEQMTPRDKLLFKNAQKSVFRNTGTEGALIKLEGLSKGFPNNAEIAHLFVLAAIEVNPKVGLEFLQNSSFFSRTDSVIKSIRKIELYERLNQEVEADNEERMGLHAFKDHPLFKAKSLERLIDTYLEGEQEEGQLELVLDESANWVSPLEDDDAYLHFVDAYLTFAIKNKDFLEPAIELVEAEYFCQRKLRLKPEIVRDVEETDPNKQFQIGYRHATGEGVPQDYQEAIKWFFKAAESNQLEAIAWIGYSYTNGWGVDSDLDEALVWYEAGAKLGHEGCVQVLNEIKSSGEEGDAPQGNSLETSNVLEFDQLCLGFKEYVTEQLGEVNDFWVGKDIQSNKLINATSHYLVPRNEKIVALIDTTVMGSAKNGLVFTANGNLYMNNSTWSADKPGAHSCTWEVFKDCVCKIDEKSDLEICIGTLKFSCAGSAISQDQAIAVILLFRDFHHSNQADLQIEEEHSDEDVSFDQLCANFRDIVSSQVGEVEDFFIGEEIPAKKIANAKIKCEVPPNESIVALFDLTVMGSAKNALLLTFGGSLYFHNGWEAGNSGAHNLPWESWSNCEIKDPLLSHELTIGAFSVDMSGSTATRKQAKAILEIFHSLFQ